MPKINYRLTDEPFLVADNGDVIGIVSKNGKENYFPAGSGDNAITALAGGGQSTSLQNYRHLRVTVVATGNDSITLPKAIAGMSMTVTNADSADSMNVFPALGDSINALGANAAYAMAANKMSLFTCALTGAWHAIVTA